jgi:hypothetical protein
VARVRRKLLLASPGVHLEIVELDHGRDQSDVTLGHHSGGRFVHPRPVLDAIDSCRNQLADGLLTKDVRSHSTTQFVGASNRGLRHINWPQWDEITDVPVDPVPDQLHPTVTTGRLPLHLRHQFVRLDLLAVVTEVALRPGNVPPGSDDLGQIGASIDPAGIGRATCIAQQ